MTDKRKDELQAQYFKLIRAIADSSGFAVLRHSKLLYQNMMSLSAEEVAYVEGLIAGFDRGRSYTDDR